MNTNSGSKESNMDDVQYYINEYSNMIKQLESGSMQIQFMNTQVTQLDNITDVSDKKNSIKLIYYNNDGNVAGEHFLHISLLERMTEQMQLFTFRTVIEKLLGRSLANKFPPR